MSVQATLFTCHGCGATVDPALTLPFRCPAAGQPGDDIDHVLLPQGVTGECRPGSEPNPFLRYRTLLSPYRLARAAGLSDVAWEELVGRLDERLAAVDGQGFRITPMATQPALARAVGFSGTLWVKDETGNVSGSHKGRHLMGTMLYLRVLQAAHLAAAEGLARRRLAIASCGNAALAAAVIARAADWPLEVFIPHDANARVVRRLAELGAVITVCERRPGESGDPCFLRFREAVQAGGIPFSVQGTENGLAVEGARTLAFEMAETFHQARSAPDAVFVQVGGGALASALAQGYAAAVDAGLLARSPRLFAVQTASCAPLARAWKAIGASSLPEVVRHRRRYMWPWETTPHSIADGILDDETYDWFEIASAMRLTGGSPVIVGEEELARAQELGRTMTAIRASATGTAGLAGLLGQVPADGQVAVIFSGVDRDHA